MNDITLKIELPDQFVGDVMTTAVESGGYALWYWEGFNMVEINRARANPEDNNQNIAGVVLDDLTVYRIKFTVDHPQDNDEYIVEFSDVVTGIQWILDGTVPVTSDIVGYIAQAVAEKDAGHIDAIAADCIMQAACFKELVFG